MRPEAERLSTLEKFKIFREKVSPTRILFGNIRSIRLRDFPGKTIRTLSHPNEPTAFKVQKSTR